MNGVCLILATVMIAIWNAEHITDQLQQPSSSSVVVIDVQEEEDELEEYEGRCPWCHSAPCHCEENAALCQRGCYDPCCCAEQDAWNREHI